jgi:hypothetical protein
MSRMITIDESSSLFIVTEVNDGFQVEAYMDDQSDDGVGSKKWLNTITDLNGKRIAKRNPMESYTIYNELNYLLIKVISKYNN